MIIAAGRGKRNAYPGELNDVGNILGRRGAKITFKVSRSRPFHSKFSHSGRVGFGVELRIKNTSGE